MNLIDTFQRKSIEVDNSDYIFVFKNMAESAERSESVE